MQETITVTTHKVTQLKHDAEIMFRVAAENAVGRGPNSEPTKYVRVTTPVDAEPPVIQEPLQDSTVGLGKSVTLQCVIGGTPLPEIKWLVLVTLCFTCTKQTCPFYHFKLHF